MATGTMNSPASPAGPTGNPDPGNPGGRATIAARTLRTDRWWLAPAATAGGLLLFIIYGTFRIFTSRWYYVPDYHYLAPFYSPCLSDSCVPDSSAGFPTFVPSLPSWLSPAFIILVFPAGFRLTCYYYRKAYYRAFWLSPPACAVAEPHGKYTGETRFPLILQNIHRYFFYAAIVVAGILSYDVVLAFHDPDGGVGMGLGTLILLINVVFIWAYTLSCHSCRSIVGGRLNNFSKHPVRYWYWQQVSKLNARHQLLAWISLFTVLIADLYVLLVSAGAFSDPRFF
jgi:hypothetical protein